MEHVYITTELSEEGVGKTKISIIFEKDGTLVVGDQGKGILRVTKYSNGDVRTEFIPNVDGDEQFQGPNAKTEKKYYKELIEINMKKNAGGDFIQESFNEFSFELNKITKGNKKEIVTSDLPFIRFVGKSQNVIEAESFEQLKKLAEIMKNSDAKFILVPSASLGEGQKLGHDVPSLNPPMTFETLAKGRTKFLLDKLIEFGVNPDQLIIADKVEEGKEQTVIIRKEE